MRLQKFRSYKDSSFEFDPGVNIVIGPNASGKTNLLEAILVLASGSSFRARDIELVKHREPWARLDGWFGQDNRTVKIVVENERATKTFELNGKPYKRLSLERTVPAVLFEPNHLQLLIRGPDQRRDYFDGILERTEPGYKSLLGQYRRTLAQRNSLLKQAPDRGQSQMFAWNIRLSELGGKIAAARQQLADNMNKELGKTYSRIAGKRSAVKLAYEAGFQIDRYTSAMLKKLEASTRLDYQRGFTAYGPHREDLVFHLNRRPAAAAASRGETRSLLIALKVYELKLVEKMRGAKPVLLLDDVFSELDGSRRHHLVDYLKDYQTIITTTDADSVMQHFADEKKLLST